jgi:N-acetylglucosamine-6-phosphate deacetylase
MERAFAKIVTTFGATLVDAAMMCATTPARQLGMTGHGVIAEGAIADLVILDREFKVMRTFVGGEEIYSCPA